MAAYCVGSIKVKDAAAWQDYRSQVNATISQYGGQVLIRGEMREAFSGADDHDFVVVLRFESIEAAKRWNDSPEYRALVPLRDRGADVALILYQDLQN